MENENLARLNTAINRLKVFSCPEFKDVYSNQYFQNIIKNFVQNYSNTYSVIFGDFNKLGIINEVYGENFGDQALKLSMKIIQESLPNNAMVIRAGGDEIYIVIPSCNKDQADNYCKKINSNLSKNATLVGGLSIELASTDSTISNNIDELINIADSEVTNIKASRKKGNSPANMLADDFLPLSKPNSISEEESKKWDELNKQINICIYNFLQNFRPSKTLTFEKDQILDASSFITSSFAHLLSEKVGINLNKNIKFEKKLDFTNSEEEKNKTKNCFSNHMDSSTAQLIHSLVSENTSINPNDLSDEEIINLTDSMNKLIESLIRDRTGLLSKQYFKLYLSKQLSNPNQPLSSSYISTSGIKLSNLAFDHSVTDDRLDKTNDILIESIIKENLDYNNIAFKDSDNDIHILSQGAGNYLFLYPTTISTQVQSKVKNIVDNINSSSSLDNPNSPFKVAYYSSDEKHTFSSDSNLSLTDYVKIIKEKADLKKDELKKELFKSNDAYIAFCKSIDSSIQYYLDNIPDASNDINNLILFIKNVHTALLNQEVLHNTTKQTKKTGTTFFETNNGLNDFSQKLNDENSESER